MKFRSSYLCLLLVLLKRAHSLVLFVVFVCFDVSMGIKSFVMKLYNFNFNVHS